MDLSLSLSNFRRFSSLELSVAGPTIIIGPNGTGKSTILEALAYLAVARSYRTTSDRDLIHWDESVSRASVRIGETSVERVIARQSGSLEKRAFVNQVPTTPLESIGQFHYVLFSPELIELITGPPRIRRRYLDTVLAGVDPVYARTLAEYSHVLKQRNELLNRRNVPDDQFLPWETALARLGAHIAGKRRAYVQFVAALVSREYEAIAPSGPTRGVHLAYASGVEDETAYLEALTRRRQRDRELRATTLGPHRDDLVVTIDELPAASATSRGEQRSLLVALKQAERNFLEAKVADHPPLLLLDDVFSELDELRAERLGRLVADAAVLVTSADPRAVPPSLAEKATTLAVSSLVPVA